MLIKFLRWQQVERCYKNSGEESMGLISWDILRKILISMTLQEEQDMEDTWRLLLFFV